MSSFKDHFSAVADGYAAHRPGYPPELFEWLATQAPSHDCVWDCATGSGQAAVSLANHFSRVIATDASEQQIAHAEAVPNVAYRVAEAGDSGLPASSVDLITVAQALHWFDLEAFYREVARVLKPDGVLAVWTYNLATVTPAVDVVVNRFYDEVINEWWPPGREHVEEGYRRLTFPYSEMVVPPFAMRAHWRLEDLFGYLHTWSAVKRYREATGEDPVKTIEEALCNSWGAVETLEVRWPLTLRVGRKAQDSRM